MLPKKLQVKAVPKGEEFAGRDVWKHSVGDDAKAMAQHYQSLSDEHYNDLMMHVGGYYSVPKKTKKTK